MNTVNVMLEAVSMININMRCIEMSFMFLGTLYNKRLTLT